MDTPLIQTKLRIPGRKKEIIKRQPLFTRLDQGLGTKLSLVSAPAGFGKTSLLSSWIHQSEHIHSTAWLSLDENDNDPVRFYTYFCSALKKICPDIELPNLPNILSPQTENLIPMLIAVINTLDQHVQSVVLVLDDYHTIEEPVIDQGLNFLVQHQPENLHLIVSSRIDPSLPLSKLRAKGELVEIRAADLQFSIKDAQPYLNTIMNLELSKESIDVLVEKTEGWIAGLQLAAVSMQNQPHNAGFIESFSDNNRYIMDYLVDEVLDKLDSGVTEFLLKTAFLNQIDASLCDFVVENDSSSQILDYLDSINLFISQLEPQRKWYRYHRLFTDILRQRAQQLFANEVEVLNQRAGNWYEEAYGDSNDDWLVAEAIYHYTKGNLPDKAAELIESQADTKWRNGEVLLLNKWINSLPHDIVSSHPKLEIYRGWALLTTGKNEDFAGFLKNSENSFLLLSESAENMDLLGRLSFLKSVAATFSGHYQETAQFAEKALDQLAPDNIVWRSGTIMSLGDAKASLGKLVEADQAYAEAVALSRKAGNAYMSLLAAFKRIMINIQMGLLYPALELCDELNPIIQRDGLSSSAMAGCVTSFKGAILCEFNRFDEGVTLLEEGLKIAEKDPHIGMKGWCHLNRIWGMLQLGELDNAQLFIDQLSDLSGNAQLPPLIKYPLDLTQVGLWLLSEDLPKVLTWIKKTGLDQTKNQNNPLNVPARLLAVRYYLQTNNITEAEKNLTKIIPSLKADQRVSLLIEALSLMAIAHFQSGKIDPALAFLEEALSLGKERGYLVKFRDCRIPIELLELARKQKIFPQYIDTIIDLFRSSPMDGTELSNPNAKLTEQLSRRELEVLKLLAAGLSNQEICDSLFLAIDTVKGHTRRIYGKLYVHSRSQAVATARKLGIIS